MSLYFHIFSGKSPVYKTLSQFVQHIQRRSYCRFRDFNLYWAACLSTALLQTRILLQRGSRGWMLLVAKNMGCAETIVFQRQCSVWSESEPFPGGKTRNNQHEKNTEIQLVSYLKTTENTLWFNHYMEWWFIPGDIRHQLSIGEFPEVSGLRSVYSCVDTSREIHSCFSLIHACWGCPLMVTLKIIGHRLAMSIGNWLKIKTN